MALPAGRGTEGAEVKHITEVRKQRQDAKPGALAVEPVSPSLVPSL